MPCLLCIEQQLHRVVALFQYVTLPSQATLLSSVFIQHNILDDAKLSENITSIKDMRIAIHKLLPEDLENPII
jgi:hypothetical protein